MGNCYLGDYIAADDEYTDITCNKEEPQRKNRLGTISSRFLGDLNMFYWTETSPSASAIVQPNQIITTNSTDQHETFKF